MKQTFYLTVLSAAFLSAALISDVPNCTAAPPPGNHSRPGGAPSRPGGSSRPGGAPSRPSGTPTRPGGSSTRPGGSPSRPGGSSTRPGGAPSRPSGTPTRPGGSSVRPGGSSTRPGGSSVRPGGSSTRPGGSSVRPGGSPSRPGGSSIRPGGTSTRPGGSSIRPGGNTSFQPRPSGQPGPSNGNNGGRVTRRVTTNTLTGEVLRDEYFGNTSPIYRNPPGSYDRPDFGPGYNPGHNPPPPPRPYYPSRPYYPYYSDTYYPGMPAYPPPPPGFPPPPSYWPGFIYNGLPLFLNANINVIPNYPNVQQLGLFAVYDSYGNRSGSLLVYYNPLTSKLGGYFNPAGTKYTRSIQGIVSMVNGVQTAMFTVNDQYRTECAVPFSALLAGATASGTMLTPSQVPGDTPVAAAFSLQRLQ